MKENPNTIVENVLNEVWDILIKRLQLDNSKAKSVIKEEVDYLLNSK